LKNISKENSTMRKSIFVKQIPAHRIKLSLIAAALIVAGMPMLGHAEDLTQIYGLARQADPTLAGADANKGATQEGVPQARAALLPQISGSWGYNHADQGSKGPNTTFVEDQVGNFGLITTDASARSRPANLLLTQSLFNWGNITRLRGANALAEGAEYTYDAASQDLLVRTATAYFGVLTAEDQLVFTQLNEKSLAKQLDQAEQSFEVGLKAITDVHVARAQHDAAVAQVITAQNAVETAREGVIQIIGKTFGDLKKLRDPLPLEKPSPADAQAWVDLANKQNPTIASAQKSVDSAEFNISTQRSGHYPTLSASVSRSDTPSWGSTNEYAAGQRFSIPNNNALSTATTIGVTLNIPIFTGGLVTSQTRQAVFQRDAAQDQLELQRRTIVANTRNAYRAVIAGISEVEATKASVVSAQSALDATQAGYEVGTKTIVDVLISQSTLLSAQSSYSQARHQFVLSGLQLKEAAGVVATKDLESVNALLE
jgi:outer membrane protein